MTFREKIAESIANKLVRPMSGTESCRTLVITRYKKDAIALLREFRECGDLYADALQAALSSEGVSDVLSDDAARLRRRLSLARVSVGDQKINLHGGSVYIFPEKEADTVIGIFQSMNRAFDIIVDESCSSGTKRLASNSCEDALADVTSWIDSIPVI